MITGTIKKIFNDEISCIFATDNFYAPYLSVTIESIIENRSLQNYYSIYILEESLSDTNKRKLKLLEKDNVKIIFFNITSFVNKYRADFYLHSYVTIATYYRFFISEIFEDLKKAVYLDCDLIVNCDIADLYNIDLNGNLAGCVRDIQICSRNYQNMISDNDKEYYLKTLKLDNIDNYFNAGVMILDIDKLRNYKYTEKCIKFLKEIRYPKFSDQCIINHILRNKVLLINLKWNFQNVIAKPNYIKNGFKNAINEDLIQELSDAQKAPNIIHYICKKPWNNLNLVNSNYFWKYAKKSPFFMNIIRSYIMTKMKNTNIIQCIFSIKNSTTQRHKIITILGFKFKFQIKTKNNAQQ